MKDLVIGTSNFNQNYGLSNKKLKITEIQKILNLAKKNKIKYIDTALDYNLSSSLGKKINDELQQKSILFYNIDDGVEIINRIIKDNKNYFFMDKNLVNKIQESICYPISRKNFLLKMKNSLMNNMIK